MKTFAKPPAAPTPAKRPPEATRAVAPAQVPRVSPAPNGPTINLLSLPVHAPARAGVEHASQPLPYLERIQAAFGRHDLQGVRANISVAPAALGANAYALGERVAFRRDPDLRLAAHEAAHVVQQRGGLGRDRAHYEQYADRVAEAVVHGRSAESLLDRNSPGAAPTTAVQLDRDHEATNDTALIAILERSVDAHDTRAQAARVADLTAQLLALPAERTLALANLLEAHQRGDRLATLFHDRLSTATRRRLIALLRGRWAKQFGTSQLGGPAPAPNAATATPQMAAPARPDPSWPEVALLAERELEQGHLTTDTLPSIADVQTLLRRLQRDDLTPDAELIAAAHLEPQVLATSSERPWVRMVLATRLEMFLGLFEDRWYTPDDAKALLAEARAYLDAHSAEYVGHETKQMARAVGGLLATPAYMNQPVLTVDQKPGVRRSEVTPERIERVKRDAAIDVLLTPVLATGELGRQLEALLGFPVGFVKGAYRAVADLVGAAYENIKQALELTLSLMTGKFRTKLLELGRKLWDFITSLPDLPSKLGAWFANEWDRASPYGKGELIGKIVGYIALQIALGILTAGGSLEEEGSELAQAARRLLKVVDKAANPMTYLGPVLKPVGRAAAALPGVTRGLEAAQRAAAAVSRVTAPVREAAGALPRWIAGVLRRSEGAGTRELEQAEGAAARWQFAWRDAESGTAEAARSMPTMAEIEAAPAIAASARPHLANETHDLTPVMVDGELWLRLCSENCGPLLAKLRATDEALVAAGATRPTRERVLELIDATEALQNEWVRLDQATVERRLADLQHELESLGASSPAIAKAIADGDTGLIPNDSERATQPKAARSPNATFEATPVEFTPSTGRTYKVYQRKDIDWDQIRTAGDKRYIGKTNAEAALDGRPPQLPDGNFATLHHSQQDARGPLYEMSTNVHNISNAKEPPLHPFRGQQHPDFPLGRGKGSLREAFQAVESPEYWRWRAAHRGRK